jgi:hypothetical protein
MSFEFGVLNFGVLSIAAILLATQPQAKAKRWTGDDTIAGCFFLGAVICLGWGVFTLLRSLHVF